MPQPNIKLFLVLSGILAVIFFIILIIPLSRKTTVQQLPGGNLPTPTIVDAVPQGGIADISPTIQITGFTGVREEELSAEIVSQVNEKQSLRYETPLALSTFSIDFDYGEDKFIVVLNDPKNQSLSEFEDWKRNNYPAIPSDQFIFR